MKWLLTLAFVVAVPFGLAFFAENFVDGATLDRGISWLREATDSLAPTLPTPRSNAKYKTRAAKSAKQVQVQQPKPSQAVPKTVAEPAVMVKTVEQAQHLPLAIRDQRNTGPGQPMEKLDQQDRDRLSSIIDARLNK